MSVPYIDLSEIRISQVNGIQYAGNVIVSSIPGQEPTTLELYVKLERFIKSLFDVSLEVCLPSSEPNSLTGKNIGRMESNAFSFKFCAINKAIIEIAGESLGIRADKLVFKNIKLDPSIHNLVREQLKLSDVSQLEYQLKVSVTPPSLKGTRTPLTCDEHQELFKKIDPNLLNELNSNDPGISSSRKIQVFRQIVSQYLEPFLERCPENKVSFTTNRFKILSSSDMEMDSNSSRV